MTEGPILDPQSAFRLNMEQSRDCSGRNLDQIDQAQACISSRDRDPPTRQQGQFRAILRQVAKRKNDVADSMGKMVLRPQGEGS